MGKKIFFLFSSRNIKCSLFFIVDFGNSGFLEVILKKI